MIFVGDIITADVIFHVIDMKMDEGLGLIEKVDDTFDIFTSFCGFFCSPALKSFRNAIYFLMIARLIDVIDDGQSFSKFTINDISDIFAGI